jgi:HEAT repeat protein/class 3 adenylate cyclase
MSLFQARRLKSTPRQTAGNALAVSVQRLTFYIYTFENPEGKTKWPLFKGVIMVVFKGRKIKKLLDRYITAEMKRDERELADEFKGYGQSAMRYVIEAVNQKKLNKDKTQLLFGHFFDPSNFEDLVLLIGDSCTDVRWIAKEVIIKKGGKSFLQFLVKHIESSNFYLRTNSIELLILFKDRSIIPNLVSRFKHADSELKISIIKILGRIDSSKTNKLIITALDDESWEVRLAAVKNLKNIQNTESINPLLERLMEKEPEMKMLALDALSAISNKRAVPPVMELMKDDDLLIRQKAAECLMEIADSDSVPAIIELMKDDDVNIRRSAVEVLDSLKDPRTSSALMSAIRDSDWWVRQIATESLTKIKEDSNIVKGFIVMTRDEDENLRRCAVEFFNKSIHKSALKPLINLLKDEDWWVREKAVIALGKLKDKRAISPLVEMIDDEEVKAAIPDALAEIGGDDVIEHLKGFLLDEDKRIQIEAIKALGKLKAKGAFPTLKECLQEADEEVVKEAIKAIKEITGKTVKAGKKRTVDPGPRLVSARGGAIEGAILTEAIVVLDLCNSTAMAAKYGDNFALNLMQKLTTIVTPIAGKARYQFLKNTGDGFLLTFPKAVNAVLFALTTLRETHKHNVKADNMERINLRFGINIGETRVKKDGDRLGVAINMAFRIEGVKPEGLISIENGMTKNEMLLENRILLTESVEEEIRNREGIKTKLVGLFALKGIPGFHKVFELTSVK